MPRAIGQIDPRKSEAILEAAAELFSERGGAVTMASIARQAGVSKQTLYNRYPSTAHVARDLAGQRSDLVTAPLRSGGAPGPVLVALAIAMMTQVFDAPKGKSLRPVALMSTTAPDIAQAIYDAGPGESLRRLSAWLREQDRRGLIAVPDPDRAAEMFAGMVLGHGHLRSLLGIAQPDAGVIADRAADVVRRFLHAFARQGL